MELLDKANTETYGTPKMVHIEGDGEEKDFTRLLTRHWNLADTRKTKKIQV